MTPPPAATVERWCHDLLTTTDPEAKLAPPPPPDTWEDAPPPRRLEAPGRPPTWSVVDRAPKSPKRGALVQPQRRAELLHTFLHHEVQAAELMAWALLAWPDTPRAFRQGLLKVCRDELRHLGMYRDHLRRLGVEFGDLPVRDWFWQRVPAVPGPAEFVAVMGVGFEGGNLDHAARYAEWFRAAGDAEGAQLLDQVGEEEVAHVRFAAEWFRRLTGGFDFPSWKRRLPAPLTPTVMKGRPLNRPARRRAGLDDAFLDGLDQA